MTAQRLGANLERAFSRQLLEQVGMAYWAAPPSRVKSTARRSRTTKGDCFAKAHISTAPAPPLPDARFPRTHEVQGRPQGAGGAPQEGTPSAYPRVVQGTR